MRWQAAVLLAQLERLPEQIALRTRNAALLKSELAGLPGGLVAAADAEVDQHLGGMVVRQRHADHAQAVFESVAEVFVH